MAGIAATKFQTTRTLIRATWVSRVFAPNQLTPTHQVRFYSSSSDASKCGIEKLKKVSDEIKEKAASHTGYATSQSKEAAGKAENIAEKAKQSAQEAWDATKDTAQKVQRTVAEKAEESATAVKDNIEAAKRSFNNKK
ncbi:hypothetical protein CTI12_AA090810 [Artemisia annua]|uniref:Late embryogenesis abundant protein (LEA) family protein n=1 Tax=Artemisia annua TaxID=35608 RepID=A0A2U1PRQ0_ARTAN|nr:hypothetical protein CTI12_AA090810 [Artemisia annua]